MTEADLRLLSEAQNNRDRELTGAQREIIDKVKAALIGELGEILASRNIDTGNMFNDMLEINVSVLAGVIERYRSELRVKQSAVKSPSPTLF